MEIKALDTVLVKFPTQILHHQSLDCIGGVEILISAYLPNER